jgi:hypothetical protein
MGGAMSSPIYIRVTCAGYGGKPSSLMCAMDPDTHILSVAQERSAETKDRPGFLRVTNNEHDPHRDALFTEEEFQEAIRAYFELSSLGLLVIAPTAQRADPQSKIERDGVSEGGTKYRLSPDITCAQVATLIACKSANTQRHVGDMSAFADELMGIQTFM